MSFLSNIMLYHQDVLQGRAATLKSISAVVGPFCPCCREGGERPCGRLLCAVTTSLLLQGCWSGGGELLRWLEMEVRWLIFTHEPRQGLLAKHKSLHKWLLTNVFLVSLLFLFGTEEDERIALGINAGLGSFRWSWRFRSCQQVTS